MGVGMGKPGRPFGSYQNGSPEPRNESIEISLTKSEYLAIKYKPRGWAAEVIRKALSQEEKLKQ